MKTKIIPVTMMEFKYANTINKRFTKERIDSTIDFSKEKLGFKIRKAQDEKFVFIIVIFKDKIEKGIVSFRTKKEGKFQSVDMTLSNVIKEILKELTQK